MTIDTNSQIKTRREYVQLLLSNFGSGQIDEAKLISELTEEFDKLYGIIGSLDSELSQLKDRYNFLINLVISMPEVQNNPLLTAKIQEFYPENSHP